MRVAIKNLTLKYGDALAVDDLNLDIIDGELLVLLGPSGCGKTSTMRSIVGLETPLRGRIEIGDDVVLDTDRGINISPNKRHVGMVFQSYAIWPHMSVFENVVYPLRVKGRPKAEIQKRGMELLQTVGLSGLENRGASLLSGGQMQRVALARGLATEPRVLLLDEPLSNLDAKLRHSLRFELRELQQRLNLTTVYVTHDQEEALVLADRITIMKEGRIVQLDSPHAIYESPKTTFVADFLGMDNIFGVTVSRDLASQAAIARIDGTPLHLSGPDINPSHRFAVIRPEDVVLTAATGQFGPNRWPGEILVASFLGGHMVYKLRLDGGPTMTAVTNVSVRFPVGAKVAISADPARVCFLKD